MHVTLKFLVLISILVFTKSNAIPSELELEDNNSNNNEKTEVENKTRTKRQLNFIPVGIRNPVYYDPVVQQQPGLLGVGVNIPIIGPLIGNLPLLGTGQNVLVGLPGQLLSGVNGLNGLSGLTGGLTSTLGNLGGGLGNIGQLGGLGGLGGILGGQAPGNLGGGLGNIGQLGNLGGLGGLLGGQAPGVNNAASCPVSQKLSCRCEPAIPIYPYGTRKDINDGVVVIENQNVQGNTDGSIENIVNLSNGVTLYQKSNPASPHTIDGYYTLKINDERYLNIYFSINDVDFTVKGDVNTEPPKATLLQIDAKNV